MDDKILCPSCQTVKGREETCPRCKCPGETERLAGLSLYRDGELIESGTSGSTKPKKERESCCIADSFCEAPAGYGGIGVICNGDLPARLPKCFLCEQPVCKMCSSRRQYKGHGRKRLCNDCQTLVDGNERVVRRRLHRLARGR